MAERNKGWLETTPGIITAIATLITAIGGFIVVLHNTGYLHASQEAGMPISDRKRTIASTFQGNVGKLNATFNLIFNYEQNKISGTYYYPKKPGIMYDLQGIILSDRIELTERTNGKISANCILIENGKCYNGKMSNVDGRAFDMSFCETNN